MSDIAADVLSGGDVRLRPISIDDAEITLRWRQGKRGRYLQAGASTVDQQRAWIAGRTGATERNWIIEFQYAPVGTIALHDINLRHRSAILGRLLIGEVSRVGNAPVFFQAELLVCDFAFEQLRLHKLYGGILEGHDAMLRTREFLGYHRDGVLREHLFVAGQFRNWIAVSLLESEYRETCRPKLSKLIQAYAKK